MSESTSRLVHRYRLLPNEARSAVVAAIVSVGVSLPLILRGTPDVESYSLSIFSTVAFVRNLVAGVDPWFVPEYGFGISLPSWAWLVMFPPAIPAAFFGISALYAAVWIGGEFCFVWYLLALTGTITRHRGIRALVLVTGLLSFSNLGTTYVDDWPEHFLGWALLPACLWYVLGTLLAEAGRERIRWAAACTVAIGIFVGSTSPNEMVTFYSGLVILLGMLARTRLRGVVAVALSACLALVAALAVLAPTVQGMLSGGVNPLTEPIAVVQDDLSWSSYGSFLDPGRELFTGVLDFPYRRGRAPFFGLVVLLLAAAGAARLIGGRATAGAWPKDVSRTMGVAFLAYSALTLLPSWVALGLPRMWMYRDGQTLFALLCAASALTWITQRPRLFWSAVALQVVQVSLVTAPFVLRVLEQERPLLFAYARRPRVLFDGLRRAGVDETSRVILIGGLETRIMSSGGIPRAGVTAGTDFALEGIGLVNAKYRGSQTPDLGPPTIAERYGHYETKISWPDSLRHLRADGLDVLGITHVLAFHNDPDAAGWTAGLVAVATIELPDDTRVDVFRNDDAWSRTVLLPSTVQEPPLRVGCPNQTVYCRDYRALSVGPQTSLRPVWRGATVDIALPAHHEAGRLFVSEAIGPTPRVTVDGRARSVVSFLGAFSTIPIERDDRVVRLSAARRDRMVMTLLGFALMAGCCAVVVFTTRSRKDRLE